MERKYKRKATLFRLIGLLIVASTTIGAFLVYQYVVDWENFAQTTDVFVVVNEESLKLNSALAAPMFAGLFVFFLVVLRRNRDFFSTKYSIGLILVLALMYLIYSIIEVVLFSLVGAVVGSVIDDYIFRPLARMYDIKADDQGEIEDEFEKEKRRIKARQLAREELDGSV
jgi:hypothetical protein